MKLQNKKSNIKKTKRNKYVSALNFFAEAGLLKHVKRSGWWVAGIKDPESVAEHCFRCAIIAYYMAHLEKVDANKTMLMALFNDIHEARINDLHKMGHYYIDFRNAESKVFDDQVSLLDASVQKDMKLFRKEYEEQKTLESIVARDADVLECLIQAKEYVDNGYTKAKKFFRQAPDHLKTQTAKKIWQEIKNWDSGAWWEEVVKFER